MRKSQYAKEILKKLYVLHSWSLTSYSYMLMKFFS